VTEQEEQMFESEGVDLRDEDLDALLDRSMKHDETAKVGCVAVACSCVTCVLLAVLQSLCPYNSF
jgi:hypothetical protein